MATQCYRPVLGKRIRVTRLDTCGNAPASGTACAEVTTNGFISVKLSPQVESGSEIITKKADGSLCVNTKVNDNFKRFNVEIEFCGVDPDLLEIVTLSRKYNDYSANAVGIAMGSSQASGRFALELWTGLDGQACPTGGVTEVSGYLLLPYVTEGILSDINVDSQNAISFTLTGAYTLDGNNWGTGPYNVMKNASNVDSRLPTAADPKDHLIMFMTGTTPPAPACGCVVMPNG